MIIFTDLHTRNIPRITSTGLFGFLKQKGIVSFFLNTSKIILRNDNTFSEYIKFTKTYKYYAICWIGYHLLIEITAFIRIIIPSVTNTWLLHD